ncbi:phosphoribosyltransferase family protein [Embleya sp. AB8]|uniref:phosphoribosyltransferase family protein n=1 Tax=Embleya sp. AB8 TaxID=3156304 RepID=UPI003C76659C
MTSRQGSVGPIARRLADTFTWRETPWGTFADASGWWHDPELLALLGPGLGALHADLGATVVVGIETRGLLLGPITALALGVGFVEIRKDRRIPGDGRGPAGDPMLRAATPPEYQDGGLTLVVPGRLFRPGDRVLLVDEWLETGAQASAVRRMVTEAGAEWIGAAVVVDACAPHTRARLDVRGLLTEDELPA